MSNLRLLKSEPETVDVVVQVLEEALARAARGEIRGVVVAYDLGDGEIEHRVAWGPGSSPIAIVGELELAKFDILVADGRLTPP